MLKRSVTKTFPSLALLAVAACSGASAQHPSSAYTLAASSAPGVSARASVTPLGLPRTGSTVVLATEGGAEGRTLAYTADEDDWAVHVVDVDSGKELGATPLGGRPSQVMFLPGGDLVVAMRDLAQVRVFAVGAAPERLELRRTAPTAPEPVGLALSPDDTTLLVSSGWGRALAAFDARTLARTFEVPLGREPRAVVVSDDGRFAYVSHAVGATASRVDLQTRQVSETSLRASDPQRDAQKKQIQAEIDALTNAKQPVGEGLTAAVEELGKGQPSCQGYALAKSTAPAGRILAPQVLVDTGDPSERAPGYGNDDSPTEMPDVAVIDAATGEPVAASLERRNENVGWGGDPREQARPACILPRAAALDPARQSLFVSCFGIDAVVEYDALAASPARAERQRWLVGAGPSGLALDPAKERIVVWSQFDHAVSVIDLGAGELVDDRGRPPPAPRRITMAPSPTRPIAAAAALGRLLFHTVDDARIARDGRACASCHPDGRDDALTWATPTGPRRSIMLAGRVKGTAPYSWSGTEDDLDVHLATTFDRLNGAGGLKSVELDALEAYVESLAPPPPPRPAPAAGAQATIARGAKLFASTEVGCASCHSGATGSDNVRHDVSSKTAADRSATFNTPTLRYVGGTGPYFHDGRYATLGALLAANGDAMGHTKQLSHEDLDALEAYLRTR